MFRFNDEASASEGSDSLLNGGTGGKPDAGSGAGDPPSLPEGAFMAKDFKLALPEELRNNEGLGKINTLEDMTRSYLAAQRMVGRDPAGLVELPKPDAKFEDRKGILAKLGAPEKADGYRLTLPEDAPPAISTALALDTPLGKAFLDTAAQTGMLPEQTQAVYGLLATHLGTALSETAAKTEADHAANIQSLKTEAGQAFDEWIQAASFGIQKLGGDKLRDVLNDAGLGTNPLVVKAMVQVGKMMAEDTASGGGMSGGKFGTLAPAEARARAKELVSKAMTEENPVEKRRLQAEAQKYFAQATGEKPLPA